MNIKITLFAASCSAAVISFPLSASDGKLDSSNKYQHCLLENMVTASADTTVEQLRTLCTQSPQNDRVQNDNQDNYQSDAWNESGTPFDNRSRIETETRDELFVLSPHKPNYFLPISYSSRNPAPQVNSKQVELDKTEVQFQVSLKVPVAKDVFGGHGDIYVAYTNHSWWQAYNKDVSSPFRESNHEPEIFYNLTTNHDLFGMKVRNLQLGISHQSNGRSGDLSRSWNRIYASILLEKNNFYLGIKPWLRIKEEKKSSPEEADGDDNPDITKFLGYGELTMFYKFQNDHAINVMMRNNLRSDNKGAFQLGWSFPFTERLRGYVQYFTGYGESLIDYNNSVSRLSFGVLLTDWL